MAVLWLSNGCESTLFSATEMHQLLYTINEEIDIVFMYFLMEIRIHCSSSAIQLDDALKKNSCKL